MFLKIKLYLDLNCVLILHSTELFEMEVFFDIETVLTLNWIVIYRTVLTFYCVNKIYTYVKLN